VENAIGGFAVASNGPKSETTAPPAGDPLIASAVNLSRFHREHEKYYSVAPLQDAVDLQHTSHALMALAERWSRVPAGAGSAASPFTGAEDLNDERAIEIAGILFMEGEGEPAEITRIKRDLRAAAASHEEGGAWLTAAMEQAWTVAAQLTRYPQLADLLGERHRIITNDWQSAELQRLIGRLLARVADILDAVDFRPATLRQDLATPARYLFSASELLGHAVDLTTQSAALVHDNERRWRVFRERAEAVSGAQSGGE
jgi:hypothetical protein